MFKELSAASQSARKGRNKPNWKWSRLFMFGHIHIYIYVYMMVFGTAEKQQQCLLNRNVLNPMASSKVLNVVNNYKVP